MFSPICRMMKTPPFHVILGIIICILPYSLQDCARPTDLNDHIIIKPDETDYFTWYFYEVSCETGYTLEPGTTTFYCYENTTGPDYWNPASASAECAPQCTKPNAGSGVTLTPNQTYYDPQVTVTFSCGTGSVVGPTSATCQSDATWNYAGVGEPSCAAGCPAPSNSNGTGSYDPGDVETFQCDPGFELESGDKVIKSTCSNGVWSPAFLCESLGCAPPMVPSDVVVTRDSQPVAGYSGVNEKVDLTCDGEKTPIGPEFSYCNETNQWEPDPMLLACYDKCPTPSFDDSRVIHTSKLAGEVGQAFYDHTDTIRFSCEGGIFVDGPWKATCKDGTWSGKIGGYRPVCKANCTAPVNTNNAGDVFQHTQRHEFQCVSTPGMVRLGGPKAFCNDGNWKPNIRCALKTEL